MPLSSYDPSTISTHVSYFLLSRQSEFLYYTRDHIMLLCVLRVMCFFGHTLCKCFNLRCRRAVVLRDTNSIIITCLGPWIYPSFLYRNVMRRTNFGLLKYRVNLNQQKIKKVVCIEYVCENVTVRCDEVKRQDGGVNCLERVRLYLRLSYLTMNTFPTF